MQLPGDMRAFNETLIAEFRANGGKLSGRLANSSLLLLTTIGARTGQPRVTPMGYVRDGERYAVIAANAGAHKHPDWYHNLLAQPGVVVEVGSERFAATARVAEHDERERLIAMIPYFAAQQAKTQRVIPVVVLERV
ncbi:MAG TPA: nitroreductase family deazaflavin-dependent oxidoreductase [Ktedonobacterales bacterium]